MSSGGTSAALSDAGIPHLEVADLTGAPEMLSGRVKTLHPVIHGGILADRSKPDHLDALDRLGIGLIDLVVCNLYPFPSDPSVELIDIGGPTMVRAAAKNHDHVAVVVSPEDYPGVLAELRQSGSLSEDTRRRLARAAFAHTAGYDAAIVEWLDAREQPPLDGPEDLLDVEAVTDPLLPPTIHLTLERAGSLRYGENPHQHGARYRIVGRHSWWDDVVQHGGKELSYLNIFDADAAWRLVHELSSPDDPALAVAIIKHANPCGAALHPDLVIAYQRALACDPASAFGGIVAIGGPVTVEVAEAIAAGPQADVIIAPSYEDEALARLAGKRKATRLLSAPAPEALARQLRVLGNSVLVQDADRFLIPPASLGGGHQGPTDRSRSGATWLWPGRCAPAPPPTPSPWSTTARRWGWVPVSSRGWWRPRSRWPRPDRGASAGRRPVTPSSPFPTGCWSWPTPGWPPWSNRGDRCGMAR